MIRLIDGLKNAFPEVEISVMELLKASRMPLLLPCSLAEYLTLACRCRTRPSTTFAPSSNRRQRLHRGLDSCRLSIVDPNRRTLRPLNAARRKR